MENLLRALVAAAIATLAAVAAAMVALIAFAAIAPAHALDFSTDNILEARLGGERLVLHPPKLATTTYTAHGSSFLASVLINSGALAGVVDGPKGVYSGWMRGSLSATYNNTRPNMLNGNLAANWDYTPSPNNSEAAAGFNIVFDNASATNGNLRFNLNNSTSTVTSNMEASYVSPVSPLLNTAWQHVLISWDFSGSTSYAAVYINGVNQNLGVPQLGAASFNYSYAGSGAPCVSTCGFALGGNMAASSPIFADMADVFIDFSHSILQAGVNTIAPADIAKFYNTTTKKPVRINKSGNCSDPYGWVPTMCFTNDNATFATNSGSGGTFSVLSAPTFATPALAPSNVAVVAANYPTPIAAHTVTQNWQNGAYGGTSSVVTAADSNQIAVGDLLVAIIQVSSNSGDPGAIVPPSGWSTIYSAYCACAGDAFLQRSGVFYKIATSADATAYNGVTATGYTGTGAYTFTGPTASRASSWRLIDYVGVNQTTPIDPASTGQQNATSSTNIALPTITTIYANELVVGVALDWGTSEGSYTVSGAYPRGSDYLFAQTSYRPEILHFDKQFPAAGSTSGFATVTRSVAHTSQSVVFGIVPQ